MNLLHGIIEIILLEFSKTYIILIPFLTTFKYPTSQDYILVVS